MNNGEQRKHANLRRTGKQRNPRLPTCDNAINNTSTPKTPQPAHANPQKRR